MKLQARPTMYRGIQMRSRLEARVAQWFDQHEIPWVYEPACFADTDGQYLPDFELKDFGVAGRPKRPLYVEVKPTWELADRWKDRMFIIHSSIPYADLLTLAPGYLDFSFGYGNDAETAEAAIHEELAPRTPFGTLVGGWLSDDGDWRPDPTMLPAESGSFQRCALCKQVTLTINIDSFACARCGVGDGDHHLSPLAADLPIPYERQEGHE